ncbi:MAG: MaoC/PaaZ C-terminal domain-containing protein [Clostridia bacterium]
MRAGDRLGPFTHEITREQLVRYAGASGDFNPIHYDDERARGFGLPGVIAHGMLNMGLLGRYLMSALPPGARFEEYGVRFRAMVRPGDVVTISGRVEELQHADGRARATLAVELAAAPDTPAISGRAVVSWPHDPEEDDIHGKA